MNIQIELGVNTIQVQSGNMLVSLHDIAMWNEYGTRTAPPRAAFRRGAEAAILLNKKYIEAYLVNAFALSQQRNVNPKKLELLLYNLLKRIAQSCVKEVKEIIRQGSTAPNAPATIKQKGFDHPLYHYGTLLKNVNYVIKSHG